MLGHALGWIYLAAFLVLSIVTDVLGLVVVPVLALARAWAEIDSRNPMFPGKVWAWRGDWLTLVWGNDEDGIGGPGRIPPTVFGAIKWAGLRNRSNNLRLLPGASLVLATDATSRQVGPFTIWTIDSFRQSVHVAGRHFGWLIVSGKKGDRSWPTIG